MRNIITLIIGLLLSLTPIVFMTKLAIEYQIKGCCCYTFTEEKIVFAVAIVGLIIMSVAMWKIERDK